MSFALESWASEAAAEVDAVLHATLTTAWPPSFLEMLRYPVFSGGKRVRPLLSLAAAQACGATRQVALAAGAAVELVHTYSLVHDDLPCMDDDDERRGRLTVHKAFGEAPALLVGDALLTEAFTLLTKAPLSAEMRITLVAILSTASGKDGMVGGQQGDICSEGVVADADALAAIHARKTGALMTAAVMMGGVCAGADHDVIAKLRTYGEAVGLAFQLADDILDADEDDGSPSYVRLLGLDETRRRARALVARAVDEVSSLSAPDALIALAHFSVARTY